MIHKAPFERDNRLAWFEVRAQRACRKIAITIPNWRVQETLLLVVLLVHVFGTKNGCMRGRKRRESLSRNPKTRAGDVAVRQETSLPGVVLLRMLRLIIRVRRPLAGVGVPSYLPPRGRRHGPPLPPDVFDLGVEVRRRVPTRALTGRTRPRAQGPKPKQKPAALTAVRALRRRYVGAGSNIQTKAGRTSEGRPVRTKGCHGCMPEDHVRALYPYALRIRAGDEHPKCMMRKGGDDIAMMSDRSCDIFSDPYPRYECHNTGVYMVMRLPASREFRLNAADLSFRVPTIGGLKSEHFAATGGDPARPGWNHSITRLDPITLLSECDTRFRTVILTSVYTNGEEPLQRRPLGRGNQV